MAKSWRFNAKNAILINFNVVINIYNLCSSVFEFIRKTLLTDVWQQRKVDEIAAARRLSPAKTQGNRCCQTDRFFFINVSYEYSVQYLKEI